MVEIVYADRVKELTLTTGTGNYTLAGAVAGFQTFIAGIGALKTTHYCCTNGTDWEVGYGAVQSGGTSINRGAILASSNSNAAVNWPAGAKTIFAVIPAAFFELFTGPLVPSQAAGRNEVLDDTSAAIGAWNKVTGPASLAIGSGGHAWLPGQLAISGGALDSAQGSAQFVPTMLQVQTVDATPAYLLPVGISGDYNELTLSKLLDDRSGFYQVHVIAREAATGDSKSWLAEWMEDNSGGTVTIIGTPTVTAKFASAGAAAWTLTVQSTAHGARLQVTGENSHDINWHGTQLLSMVA